MNTQRNPLAISRGAATVTASLALVTLFATAVQSQDSSSGADPNAAVPRPNRYAHSGVIQNELAPAVATGAGGTEELSAQEAPTGFDNLTNGFTPQGPAYDTLDEDNVVAGRSFNDNRFIFEETEGKEDGLGPTYNAQSCRECHQNIVTGGASQIAEHRTGYLQSGSFVESIGGSLIHSRATYPEIVELVATGDTVRTFRLSTNTLGDGFIECISNETLLAIRDHQPSSMRGNALFVAVLEGHGNARIGRFGWKCQHASLESFSADAYLNEMGITSPMLPVENTSSGQFVGMGSGYDDVDEPEDKGDDVEAFADFMRSTKAPPRGPIDANVTAGSAIFKDIGCEVCHVSSITTAAPGTWINDGTFRVPFALGNKIIHAYSDFMLHDIGSGDGIPVLPGAQFAITARQLRTAPLWGLRTRNRLMHDGLAFSRQDAIQRHGGQASQTKNRFNHLSSADQQRLLAFLDSL